jgi:hypothetical protein
MGRTAALLRGMTTIIAIGSVGLKADIQAPVACVARQTLPAQVRPLTCRTGARIIDGMARSATLRRLIDRVGELNGIVYIKDAYYVDPQTKRVLSGALSHQITMAGVHRVLHLRVAPESGDRLLISLGHELQHAIEVLEVNDVTTEAAVDRLFERIGVRAGAGVMETTSAVDAGRAVARDLSANRQTSKRTR